MIRSRSPLMALLCLVCGLLIPTAALSQDQLRQVQTDLRSLGLYNGSVDGTVNPEFAATAQRLFPKLKGRTIDDRAIDGMLAYSNLWVRSAISNAHGAYIERFRLAVLDEPNTWQSSFPDISRSFAQTFHIRNSSDITLAAASILSGAVIIPLIAPQPHVEIILYNAVADIALVFYWSRGALRDVPAPESITLTTGEALRAEPTGTSPIAPKWSQASNLYQAIVENAFNISQAVYVKQSTKEALSWSFTKSITAAQRDITTAIAIARLAAVKKGLSRRDSPCSQPLDNASASIDTIRRNFPSFNMEAGEAFGSSLPTIPIADFKFITEPGEIYMRIYALRARPGQIVMVTADGKPNNCKLRRAVLVDVLELVPFRAATK